MHRRAPRVHRPHTPRAMARARRITTTTLAATAMGLAGAGSAYAFVYTSIVDFNLSESTATYPGGPYTVSAGENSVQFRWTDDPDHTTAISANACGDLGLYGKADIGAHDTGYHQLAALGSSTCFRLRGRTAAGAGSMVNHDGILAR